MMKSFEGLCSAATRGRGITSHRLVVNPSAATAKEGEYLCAYERIQWSEGVCRLKWTVDHLCQDAGRHQKGYGLIPGVMVM